MKITTLPIKSHLIEKTLSFFLAVPLVGAVVSSEHHLREVRGLNHAPAA